MPQARDGKIVTFYSFKGGTGRTMALANVAWILAASGKRVLAVDWDLESPGLHRYFSPFVAEEAVRHAPGVIDMIREFESEARRRGARREKFDDVAEYARVSQYTQSLEWKYWPEGATLDFMSSGRQNMDYTSTIGNLGWDVFYEKFRGSRLFQALRADMKARYDYTLIDSRTGFGDIAGICTFDLPDVIVNCFTLNTQGIEGAATVAADVARYRPRDAEKRIRVLPVPMRVENAEKAKLDAGRSLARRRLGELPEGMTAQQRDEYWTNAVIPYQSFYAYEETLATFGDDSSGPMTLLGAYQRLTGFITDGEVTSMPAMDPALRESWRRRFERTELSEVTEVLLDCEPEDEAWAEWIERVLAELKIQVFRRSSQAAQQHAGSAPMSLTILSHSSRRDDGRFTAASAADQRASTADHDLRRAVYVSDMQPFDHFPLRISENLTGQTAVEAARRLARLIGAAPPPEHLIRPLIERYPAREPKISNAAPRNARFTGRAKTLRTMRERLRLRRPGSDLPPIALLGLGGIGKTQLALEYVHRYKSDYDIIWWIQSGTQSVDSSLNDLGDLMTKDYGIQVGVGAGATTREVAQAVVRTLTRSDPVERWLLVLDAADDPRALRDLIPTGAGHVLVTSRDRRWEQYAEPLDVDVFSRSESVAHLVQRVQELKHSEADRLAAALGDLPLAVAFTGAWLNETRTPAADHLRRLEQHGPLAISDNLLKEYPEEYPETLATVLDSSLDQVRAQSAAAHRLLELCSLMNGEGIALELIYSQAMVSLLAPFDAALSEGGDIARLVQQLNRLALIKLDTHRQQFQIHRLLQMRVQQRLAEAEADIDAARHEVHSLLADSRPVRNVDDPSTWTRYRMLWPHLETADAMHCRQEPVRSLMVERVRYLWWRGGLPEANDTARAVERAWQAMLDAGLEKKEAETLRKQLLHLRYQLGTVLRDQARYQEAWDLDTQVLHEQRALLGTQHRHTLMTSMSLAADLRALGQYQEALVLDESTFKSWTDTYGEVAQTLSATNNLALSYRLAGRYSEARNLDEQAYEGRRNTLGELHPRTLNSASAIGRDMREAGRYSDSVGWLKDLLDTSRRQPEPNQRIVAEIEVNLAASLRAAGQHAEAAPHLDAAYERLERLYGEDQAETLACRLCRSANLLAADDYGAADDELAAILAVYQRSLGPNHPITLVCTSNRVAVLRSLGEPGLALSAARDAARQLSAGLGPDYPYTLAARMNLAVCLADAGALEESRDVDEDTAERLTVLLGAEHPDTLRAMANLGLTRVAEGEGDAPAALSRVIDRLAQVIGRHHPSVAALKSGSRVHRVLDPQTF